MAVSEYVRRALLQLRDLETELDEERKQRVAAVGSRKKLESDLKMSAQQVDIVTKAKDDIAKQLKRAQVSRSSWLCLISPSSFLYALCNHIIFTVHDFVSRKACIDKDCVCTQATHIHFFCIV